MTSLQIQFYQCDMFAGEHFPSSSPHAAAEKEEEEEEKRLIASENKASLCLFKSKPLWIYLLFFI